MAQKLSAEFASKLRDFQSETIDLQSFQAWVEFHCDQLEVMIAPGALLKLRRGGEPLARKVAAELLPTCADCVHLCGRGIFSSRQEHAACAARVEDLIRTGKLSLVPPPGWFHPSGIHFGADRYFKCATCGAIWTLVEPEREDNGVCERVA